MSLVAMLSLRPAIVRQQGHQATAPGRSVLRKLKPRQVNDAHSRQADTVFAQTCLLKNVKKNKPAALQPKEDQMLGNRLMLFVLFSLLCTPLVFGQATSGVIAGTVTDQQGAVVPGATVTIKNLDTALQRQLATYGSGYYRV